MIRICKRRAVLKTILLLLVAFTIVNLLTDLQDFKSSWCKYYKDKWEQQIYDDSATGGDTLVVVHEDVPDNINLKHFTDLLMDMHPNADNEYSVVENNKIEIGQNVYENDHKNVNENIHDDVNENAHNLAQVSAAGNWLLESTNILVHETVSDDLMPDYFDLSADLVPQFERYYNETKLIMEKRLEKIRKGCVRKSVYLKLKQDFLFYFPELNMAWCPAFKAGSTNWKQFFCKIYNPEVYNEYLEKVDEDPYCPLGVLMDHLKNPTKVDELKRKEWNEGVTKAVKFLTVRHPYERLVSVYENKFKNCESRMFSAPKGRMVQILQNYRNVKVPLEKKAELIEAAQVQCVKKLKYRVIDEDNPYMNPMGATFKEFVEYIVQGFNSRSFPDYHWISLTKGCDLCITEYDVVEKVETLERDHYFLLKMAGQESRYPDIAGAHSNPSGKSMNREKITSYFSTLNERLIWDIQSIYSDDFDLFGYNPIFRVKKNPYNMM